MVDIKLMLMYKTTNKNITNAKVCIKINILIKATDKKIKIIVEKKLIIAQIYRRAYCH